MRVAKVMVVAIVAAVACSAIGAVDAGAALPEWGKCEATAGGTGGRYSDPGCVVKVHKVKGQYPGGYEWSKSLAHGGVPNELFSNGREAVTGSWAFETAAGIKIECQRLGVVSEIELVAPKNQKTPLLEFRECQSVGAIGGMCGDPNGSPFGEEGGIGDNPEWLEEPIEPEAPLPGWVGKLGYIEGKGTADPVVGQSYGARNHDEKLFEPIVCESEEVGTVWIGGEHGGGNSVIGAISPVDEMSGTYTQTYSESAPGVQSPEGFENRGRDVLQAFIHNRWEPLAIAGTVKYELEEPVEIKASG